MIYFGDNLKYLRSEKGLTIQEIANEMGFSRTQWTNYENNLSFPKFLDLIEIAKYFDITETDLIHKNIRYSVPESANNMDPDREEMTKDLFKFQKKEIESLQSKLNLLKEIQSFRPYPADLDAVAEPEPELKYKKSNS